MYILKYFSKLFLILLVFSFAEFAQVNFSVYDISNSILTTNNISKLVKDQNGVILIGTRTGLFKYQNNELQIVLDGNASNFIIDNRGNIWIGRDNYFLKYDGIKWITIDSGQTCFSDLGPFEVYNDGIKWIFTEKGLTLYKDSVLCQTFIPEQIGVDPGYFIQMYMSKDEIFWCAGDPYLRSNVPAGLAKTDGIKWTTKKNTFKFSIDETNHIVWGISWDTLEKINYNDLSTIAKYALVVESHFIFADRESNVWTGDFNGLYRFNADSEKWEKFNIQLDNFEVNSMAEDNNDNLIIGTKYNGLVVIDKSKVTGIKKSKSKIIKELYLAQNYPNPFNHSSFIRFSVPSVCRVKLIVANILGKTVKILINDIYKPGEYNIKCNMDDLPSGIYFYSLITNTNSISKKMILLK